VRVPGRRLPRRGPRYSIRRSRADAARLLRDRFRNPCGWTRGAVRGQCDDEFLPAVARSALRLSGALRRTGAERLLRAAWPQGAHAGGTVGTRMFDTYAEIFEQRAADYHYAMRQSPRARDAEFQVVLEPIRHAASGLICDMPSGGGYLADYLW